MNMNHYLRRRAQLYGVGMYGLGIVDDLEEAAGDVEKGLTEAEEATESAQKLLDQAESAAKKGADVGEKILLFFSSWSGSPVKVPSLSINLNPKTNDVWRAYSAQGLVKSIAQGAEFAPQDYARFGLHYPAGKGGKGQTWDMVSGKWVGGTQAPTPPPEVTVGQMPFTELSQRVINSWGGQDPKLGMIVRLQAARQAIAVQDWTTARMHLERVIRFLTGPYAKEALAANLTFQNGPLAGKPFAPVRLDWISQAAAVVNSMPQSQRPSNVAALAAVSAESGTKVKGKDLTRTGTGMGGAGAAIGIGALLFLLLRMLG